MGELQLVSGGCLRSISVTCFQWALSCSAFWITNTPFIAAVTSSLLALGTLLRHCLSTPTAKPCGYGMSRLMPSTWDQARDVWQFLEQV